MHRYLIFGVFTAALTIATPSDAQSADDDVRCLILGTLFQGAAKKPAERQAASAVTQYYLGRVSARVPSGEVKRRYLAQARRLKAESTGPIMNACFKAMQAQGRAVDAMRRELGRSLPQKATLKKK
jgi:hypothetical protein